MPRTAKPKEEMTPEQRFEAASKSAAKYARLIAGSVSEWNKGDSDMDELRTAVQFGFSKLTKALNAMFAKPEQK